MEREIKNDEIKKPHTMYEVFLWAMRDSNPHYLYLYESI